MNKKLYVGNLDWGVVYDDLVATFSQAGTVTDAVVITDKYTGRSKGFGFVEFETEEAAQKAIEMFNGQELKGRQLVVNEAKPREEGAAPQQDTGGMAQATEVPQEPEVVEEAEAPEEKAA